MFKIKTENKVYTQNTIVERRNYSSIYIKNIGDDAAVVNQNIPLAPGETYSNVNEPYCIIDEDTAITFKGVGDLPQILVIIKTVTEIK